MSLITIAADLPNMNSVLQAVEKAGQGDLPHTKQAVRAATTDLIQRTWLQYAQGATVHFSGGTFKVNSITGAYVRSIQDGVRFPDDLTGEVFTTSPHGSIIEKGIKPFDQKRALLNSPKAKRNKDGGRYITVPFRHGTPNTVGLTPMPANVHAIAQNLGFSRRNGLLKSMWTQQRYSWGGKLGKSAQGQRSQIGGARQENGRGYTWKTGMYSGMVRMGRPGQTQYMTFRRVSDNSDPRSWQHPGVKPRPIREAVVENTREDVLQLIRSGFEMDLYFMGLGE
jgi:hypothetical protein